MRFTVTTFLISAVLLACGGSDDDNLDSGVGQDAGAVNQDAMAPADSGTSTDSGTPADSGTSDAGFVCGDDTQDPGEDCDDGNTTDDGNGCSADCQDNHMCGNGVLEDLFESCDPALSGCCNSTCDGVLAANDVCRTAASVCDLDEVCDGQSDQCPADAVQPDAFPCTTCPQGSNCAGCFDGACVDQRAFCADILDQGGSTGDGIYTVFPASTSSVATQTATISVFCDMTTSGGGWTMVYKKSRVVAGRADNLWIGTATNTDDQTILNRELASVDYTNAFQTDFWGYFTEARLEVVTGTTTLQWIEFDLTGTDNLNWFAPDKHTASSWTDLPTDPNYDNGADRAFRIVGNRSFYINRIWNGCPNDRGWLMASSATTCFWENATTDPTDILYSTLNVEGHIPDTNQVTTADTLVIFLR